MLLVDFTDQAVGKLFSLILSLLEILSDKLLYLLDPQKEVLGE